MSERSSPDTVVSRWFECTIRHCRYLPLLSLNIINRQSSSSNQRTHEKTLCPDLTAVCFVNTAVNVVSEITDVTKSRLQLAFTQTRLPTDNHSKVTIVVILTLVSNSSMLCSLKCCELQFNVFLTSNQQQHCYSFRMN